MKTTTLILIALLLAAPAVSLAASLTVEPAYPLKMENAVVRIDGADTADLELRVTYRPNSQTAETVTVGAFSAAGTVAWTPQYAGITQLDAVPAAPDAKPVATKNVATRFDGFPLRGMIVMLLAGVILFGGMAWSIYVVYTKSPFVHEGSDHVLADD